jgi:plastocyanin
MKRSFVALAAAALTVTACIDATASNDRPAVIVTLTPDPFAPDNCVIASPDPATIRAGESVAFRNHTDVTHTILADGLNTPWTAIEPGETSGSIEFNIASTRKYYVQACGNASADLHMLIITVN